MQLRLVDQKPPGTQTPFSFLRRMRIGAAPALSASDNADALSLADKAGTDRKAMAIVDDQPEDRSEPALQALKEAAAWQAQYNYIGSDPAARTGGGLVVKGGELVVWAIDRRQPLRPLAVAVAIDGGLVFEGTIDPAGGGVFRKTGCQLGAHRALELLIEGCPLYRRSLATAQMFTAEATRSELAEYLSRERRNWQARAQRRSLHGQIDGTLARLARGTETGEAGAVPPLLRHFARRWKTGLHTGDSLALAAWTVGEILGDPARRQMFCLDADTEALLNAPAFNTEVVPGDISVALMCFWRLHHAGTDLFSDDGLRQLQYKFASAPFIGIKNNHRLVTEPVRARLQAPVPGSLGGELPVSWYWLYKYRDQGEADRLKDAQQVLALSFREVLTDALDPERLSFTPRYWIIWWSAWAMGDDIRFSRFDLALVGLLTGTDRPELAVAEHGGEYWRQRLADTVYRGLPGLTSLSGCAPDLPRPAVPEAPRCDLAIIGHVNGSGLARNMAMFSEALAGCRPLLFDAGSGRCLNAAQPQDAEVRAGVVLLCVNADTVPEVLGRFAALCDGAHVIGFFLWETDQPPETHRYGALLVDEIWTPTTFVAEAYRRIATVPVAVVGKGLRPPEPRAWQPFVAHFRDRSPAFTFLSIADFSSSIVRKNPLDAVRAFQKAFDRDNDNVRLVLKVRRIDTAHWSNIDGYWEEVERRIAADRRIGLVTGDLPHEDYLALIASCDALVSLHRGEGFAYPIADAMMLGRPVVVSDFSGTSDYCSEATALLVEVDMVSVPPAQLRCTGPIGNWAVPRLDSAVAAMRRVVTQRAEAAERAERARAQVAALYDFDAWREALLERLTPQLLLASEAARPPAPIAFASPGACRLPAADSRPG